MDLARINDNKTTQDPSLLGINRDIVVCTIVAKNYLSSARVLTDSFLEHHPEGRVFVLLVDKVDGYFDPELERFELVPIDELWNQAVGGMLFRYNIREACTALKPYFLDYIFEKHDFAKLAYFDPDILITGSLDYLWQLLDTHSIIVTPHLTEPIPLDDNYKPGEVDILGSGAYNLGFIALANTPTVTSFLHWWAERLQTMCIHDPTGPLYVDQKWIDLVPGYFDGVYVLRDPTYNVAYWNLQNRQVELNKEEITVDGRPLRFFHFSGFDPQNMEQVSKHQNRFTLKQLKHLKPLFERYIDLILAKDYLETKDWPYALGYFDNSVKIPDIVKKMYSSLGDRAEEFGDPFCTQGSNSFFNWLNESVDKSTDSSTITRLWYSIYLSRPDLNTVYPNLLGEDRQTFVNWVMTYGKAEYDIDDTFLLSPSSTKQSLGGKLNIRSLVVTFCSRLWFLSKASAAWIMKRVFGRNQRLLNGLNLISQGIDTLLAPPHGSAPTPAITQVASDIKANFGINIAGYITGEFGVGAGARALTRAIQDADIPYVLNNLETPIHSSQDSTLQGFSKVNPYPVNLIHVNADSLLDLWYEKGPGYFAGKYNIGYWFWELSHFPEEWFNSFRFYNEIWVGSKFCLESLSKVSPIPVAKIFCVDIDDSQINVNRSQFGLLGDSYIFLFNFDFHSHFKRKNPLDLVRAFKMAFKDTDDVVLVLKYINHTYYPSEAELLRKVVSGAQNIKIIDTHLRKADLYSLVASCDCFVSLHRSEGFGLTMAEAMYFKKPVIATGYSGNMDFMNVNNSFPIRYELVEVGEKDYPPFKKGYVWAEPDVSHAADLMRFVYENRDYAAKIGERASKDMKELYSPAVAGREIRERLERILANA